MYFQKIFYWLVPQLLFKKEKIHSINITNSLINILRAAKNIQKISLKSQKDKEIFTFVY